ncbi:hypothetical protein SAM40697_5649 [Streptomyces ambofaciens]|uniref:Uncharacterized protein n=1 Tax=Streptomyces ambofaciens TaxID=1889 RepID=A0ABN4PHL8_STRAM|nr:hypothetical protein [Streptomyces ambofaciens]ANB09605.1 hypothetical protein SAM40697_5649 [Streptomyces ambofaciens]
MSYSPSSRRIIRQAARRTPLLGVRRTADAVTEALELGGAVGTEGHVVFACLLLNLEVRGDELELDG